MAINELRKNLQAGPVLPILFPTCKFLSSSVSHPFIKLVGLDKICFGKKILVVEQTFVFH